MKSTVQVGINRFARTGSARAADGPDEGARKQTHTPVSLFSLLSNSASQPSAHQQPPVKKPRNALTAIFSRPKNKKEELLTADSGRDGGQSRVQLQQTHNNANNCLPNSAAPALQPGQPASHQDQGASTAVAKLAIPMQHAGTMPVTCSPPQDNGHDLHNHIVAQRHPTLPEQHAKEQQELQERGCVQECPLCGAQMPAQQLQSHVEQELAELEALERHRAAKPQQQHERKQEQRSQGQPDVWFQAISLQSHPTSVQQQQPVMQLHQPMRAVDQLQDKQQPAVTWQSPANQVQQQQPLKPLQLPKLISKQQTATTRPRSSKQHMPGTVQQQQPQQQMPWQSQLSQIRRLHQQRHQTSGQQVTAANQQQPVYGWHQGQQHQPAWQSAVHGTQHQQRQLQQHGMHQPQQQQERFAGPVQLPRLNSNKQPRQRRRKRVHSSSSNIISSVTNLQMAPSSKSLVNEPPSVVLDSFDHWGDSSVNWLDDSMIGLEGAPQSAGECWEGIGRCAAGPRTLR